jgi:hypothetical protein
MRKCAIRYYLQNNLSRIRIVKGKRSTDLIVIFLASFFLVINYFITSGLLVQGIDSLMWVTHTKYYSDFSRLCTWYDRSSLGFARVPNSMEILLGLSNTIIRDPCWIYRIAILVILYIAGLGTYEFIKHLTNDRTASLIGALFYVLNPWCLTEIAQGHLDILAGLALFPLFLFAFEKKKTILTVTTASFFLTAAHPQAIFAFGLFFIAYLLTSFKWKRKNIVYLFIVFILSGSLSMFYFIPYGFTSGFSEYSGLKPWAIEDISEYILPPWGASSMLISISVFAFFAVKYGREYKHVVFCSASAIFATFLVTSMTFPVLDSVYIWGFKNVPFFSIFRVPTRFLMVAIFCVAYMIGVTTCKAGSCASEVRIPSRNLALPKRKVLRTIIACVVAAILIPGLFLLPYPFPGNYTPHPTWISHYEWLRSQPGKLWRVYTLPVTSGWISTPYGSTQDYGTLSTLFSDKPVIGVPAKSATSYPFLEYLEYIVKNNVTDQWLKLLGAIDVKYVTSGPNMNGQAIFLLCQEGIGENTLVYINEDARVNENPFFVPLFNVVLNVSSVAGGYNSILPLLRTSLDFGSWSLHFIHPEEDSSITHSSSLVYENFTDYLMLTLEDGVRIHACQFGVDYTRDPRSDWIKEDCWKIKGKFVFNDFTLSISGEHTRTIPFTAEQNGIYEIFVRALAGSASDRGHLTVGDVTIQPLWSHYSFKWYSFGKIEVTNGQNLLQIRNCGGRNDIDEIIIVKQDVLEDHKERLVDMLRNYEGRIIFCNNAYEIVNVKEKARWNVSTIQFACDGYVLRSVGNADLSFQMYTPRTGNYSIALRADTRGNIRLQVDNELSLNASAIGEYRFYNFTSLPLQEGTHSIRLHFDSAADLDNIIVYSTLEGDTKLEDLFPYKTTRTVDFHQVDPTEYVITVENNTAMSYLVASISYHERWKAYIGEAEISPVRMNSAILGFPLNKTGTFQIRVFFTGQEYVMQGFCITLISCSIIFVALVIRCIKTRHKRSRICKIQEDIKK